MQDIELTRLIISILEGLNERHKLFHQALFQGFVFGVVSELLTILVNKSQDILRDDIIAILYQLASADFNSFYLHAAPQFIASINFTEAQKNELALLFQNRDQVFYLFKPRYLIS